MIFHVPVALKFQKKKRSSVQIPTIPLHCRKWWPTLSGLIMTI